jgi:energy-coupling factor transporter ATP-binding protein EcfA2
MNKLTKLSIKKFRNVAPTTLEFRPGLNVLLGRNATGKTTLLRLLSTVVGARGEESLRDDVMDVSYRVSGEPLDFTHTITRTRLTEPAPTLDPGRPVGANLSSLQQTDSFVFEKNGVIVTRAEVHPNEVVLESEGKRIHVERRLQAEAITSLALTLPSNEEDSLSQALAEALIAARTRSAGRMEESLERFETLLGFEVVGESLGNLWTENFGGIPRSMLKVLLGTMPEGRTSVDLSLAFLDRAALVLGYDSASARLDVERLSPEPSQRTVRLSNLRFSFKRPGEEVPHDLLSYGQKRLLAFFAHVNASRDVIIADEFVNGLDHEWITACLDEIGDRQAFLTSQNPLLLDFLRFDSVEEVRRTFILCERASGEAGPQLVWRNPTEEEAESFFLAYQTGIQRVSDILLTRGLW